MKIGFQSIAWGSWIDDLEEVLDIIAKAGYQGVEFSQRPECLGNINTLLRLLKERNLALIGLLGGTLRERMAFCEDYREAHLVVFDWHSHAEEAISNGFALALHPYIFEPKNHLKDMLELLEQHPSLKFLPDTAILTIVDDRDSPVRAIQEVMRLGLNRLAAVHLKDWSPEFGTSAHRYAHGFTKLGDGVVRIDRVLDELQKAKYDGWVVAEHNNPRKDPKTYAFTSAEWLAQKGLHLSPPPQKASQNGKLFNEMTSQQGPTVSWQPNGHFLNSMMQASVQDLNTCYQYIVEAFRELVPSEVGTLWLHSPPQALATLVAVDPASASKYIQPAVELRESLSRIAIERQLVTYFDLTDSQLGENWGYPGLQFSHPDLLRQMSLKHMVSIPIFNDSNPFHCRLLVELFTSDENYSLSAEDLSRLSASTALAVDAALNEHCAYAVAKTNIAAAEFNNAIANASTGVADIKQVQDFLKEFRRLIQDFLKCEAVSIFLVNDAGDKLELYTPEADLIWTVPESERFYEKNEGITGTVWATKQALVTLASNKEPSYKGKSHERSYEPSDPGLVAPLVDHTGEIVGVVRCRNRKGPYSKFTYDHVAIVDAIGQAAAPYLQLLRSNERRAKVLTRLTHELRHPLSVIQAVADLLQGHFEEGDISSDKLFNDACGYIRDIVANAHYMKGLFRNADFLRAISKGIHLNCNKPVLMADLIARTVQQIDALLIESEFSLHNIKYRSLSEIPPLWVDETWFQQVVFNLLSNAIKYARPDPDAFAVEIDGTEDRGHYLIHFRDWGVGVKEGLEELIFQEGYRASEIKVTDVTGQGLGLWIVHWIIEAHGGMIKLTRHHDPTEFTIYLPRSLDSRPPNSDKELSVERQ